MLTADLAQSWLRGGRTGPRYIETEDAGYLRDAAELIRLFTEHEGRARQELAHVLEEYVGLATDYKIMRGLIKLLMDRCAFETISPIDPVEIRRTLFLKARAVHPLVDDEALRAEVITDTALALGCATEAVEASLYADLPANQKLVEFEHLSESELLDLYNVAQAQALLYRCVEMHLTVEPQAAENYRELFSAIKAYRLIHTVKGNASKGYEVRLDGPVSMFHRSQKYGVQMAVFLPALLLCKGWTMRAEIAQKLGSGGRPAFFELNSRQTQLRSHYIPAAERETSAQQKFYESWARFETEWTLEPSSEVIDLGESAFIPDFALSHPDGHFFYLEILGFWTPQFLQDRLRELAHARVKNFIIAAWDELRGSREPVTRIPAHTIVFKSKLDPIMVELMLNTFVAGGDSVDEQSTGA
jgi:predicted nuclease of restriction endonuclease-like RecB superfamily